MTSAKAMAGGAAAAASDFITYLLTALIPFLGALPEAQRANLEIIVSTLVVGATVYFTPNKIPPPNRD